MDALVERAVSGDSGANAVLFFAWAVRMAGGHPDKVPTLPTTYRGFRTAGTLCPRGTTRIGNAYFRAGSSSPGDSMAVPIRN